MKRLRLRIWQGIVDTRLSNMGKSLIYTNQFVYLPYQISLRLHRGKSKESYCAKNQRINKKIQAGIERREE